MPRRLKHLRDFSSDICFDVSRISNSPVPDSHFCWRNLDFQVSFCKASQINEARPALRKPLQGNLLWNSTQSCTDCAHCLIYVDEISITLIDFSPHWGPHRTNTKAQVFVEETQCITSAKLKVVLFWAHSAKWHRSFCSCSRFRHFRHVICSPLCCTLSHTFAFTLVFPSVFATKFRKVLFWLFLPFSVGLSRGGSFSVLLSCRLLLVGYCGIFAFYSHLWRRSQSTTYSEGLPQSHLTACRSGRVLWVGKSELFIKITWHAYAALNPSRGNERSKMYWLSFLQITRAFFMLQSYVRKFYPTFSWKTAMLDRCRRLCVSTRCSSHSHSDKIFRRLILKGNSLPTHHFILNHKGFWTTRKDVSGCAAIFFKDWLRASGKWTWSISLAFRNLGQKEINNKSSGRKTPRKRHFVVFWFLPFPPPPRHNAKKSWWEKKSSERARTAWTSRNFPNIAQATVSCPKEEHTSVALLSRSVMTTRLQRDEQLTPWRICFNKSPDTPGRFALTHRALEHHRSGTFMHAPECNAHTGLLF